MANLLSYRISKISKIIGLIILFAICVLYIIPLLWLFDASFRPMIEIFQVPPVWLKESPLKAFSTYSLHSFQTSIVNWGAALALLNSVIVTASTVVLTILVCSLCAYAFAFMNFPGKNILFILILATMMLPMYTMIAPYYQVLRTLGFTNSLHGLIIPYAASAMGVFLMRQYFIRLPLGLVEAAKIDGAGKIRVWWQIIMPLSKPALASLAIIQFREVWNDFLIPMVVLRNGELFTLPIKLQLMDSQTFNKPYDAIIATGFITALIPVMAFLIFQKQFIEGLAGGIKE